MVYKNILVVKMSAIGDVIHALPVAYALKQGFPQAKITWVVEKAAYDLLTENPYIDEVILFEKHKFRSLRGLINHMPSFSRMLKEKKFDVCLDLQGLMKSAAVAYLSRAPLKLGFCNMRELSQLVSRPVCGTHSTGHVVERYLDVVRALGADIGQVKFPVVVTAQEQLAAEQAAAQAGFNLQQSYAVLAPGANWANKRWPTAYFAALSDRLYEQGLTTVVIGGPADVELAEEIITLSAAPPKNLVGKTTLKQLAHILKNAQVLVGGDTGPMHLAAGLGTAVVALMGPTDSERNGPYGNGHIVLTVSHDCAGCWKRQCAKGIDCLAAIDVEQVYQAVRQLIHTPDNGR